jgi:Magnesium chelatase, subunit ChlI
MGEPAEAPAGIPRARTTAAVDASGSMVAMSLVFEEMAMILPRYLDPPSSVARPPGAGTLMLARRLTTFLPDITLAEAIETTKIHSVAGPTGGRTALVTTRQFHAHH